MAQSNVDIAKGMYAAFGRGDVGGVLGCMAADIEWWEPENFPYAAGNPYIGPTAVMNGVFIKLATEWDKYTVTTATFHDAGNVVVVEGRYTGAFKATGKRVDAQFAHVLTFANGKVTRFQDYADTVQFRDATQA